MMPDSLPELRQVLAELRDVNKDRRRTAIMKLGMIGGEEAVRTLITVVSNRNEDLIARGRAALMLGMLGDARAVEPLIAALDAPGYQTPMYAAEALGKLGDARAIPALMNMLTSDHDKFRSVAQEALQRLGYSEMQLEPVYVRELSR
ncbi:MAG: HEAT repeat domain-containing protein [Chloroflexota bacterium]|nr:HEAT repeat domain-containing protein [Chloroflexota bacterium]